MEWIILSGSILVAAYFIYSAIQRNNNIKEKQFEQKERELELNPEYVKKRQKDWKEYVGQLDLTKKENREFLFGKSIKQA